MGGGFAEQPSRTGFHAIPVHAGCSDRLCEPGAAGQVDSQDFRITGGTTVSGFTGGRRVCHSVTFSYAFASASTLPSENRGPAIINPIGSPSFEKPHGIEIAGSPKMLNGVQFEMTSGSRGLGSSSRFSESLIVRGVMRMVGKATKSKFVKAINVFANGDQPPLRADVINHFLGTRLSGGIVHVLDCRIEVLTNTKGIPRCIFAEEFQMIREPLRTERWRLLCVCLRYQCCLSSRSESRARGCGTGSP